MKQWDLPKEVSLQDIKSTPLSTEDLDLMKDLAGSYEALFSKRARLYKERGLANKDLGEPDLRDLLLEHYTFLKRPVLIWDEMIFIGNSKKNAEAVQEFIKNKSS